MSTIGRVLPTLLSGEAIVSVVLNLPTGEIAAQAIGEDDELVTFACDLDLCAHYKTHTFAFEQHRRIEHYGLITEQTGVVPPPEG